MRKSNYFTFMLLILVLLTQSNIFCQVEHKLTKDELFDIYYNKLKELELPRINFEEIDKSEFKIKYEHDDYFDKEIAEVTCANIKFDMEIDPITGQITGCYNGLAGEDKTLYEGGAKPTKNEEEILKEAEKYLRIINGEIPKNVFLYKVEYEARGWYDSKRSYDGEWFVGWGRQEGEYRYLWDAITVFVSEKYGLSAYGYNFFSQYHLPKSINISKEKAIEIGKTHIGKITRKGFKVEGPISAELMITHQSRLAKQNKNYIPRPKSYARLVWVLKYNCIGEEIGEGLRLDSYTHDIFIDAETGELF